MKEKAKLETRYFILKIEDVFQYCTQEQLDILINILNTISTARKSRGKEDLYGVFIRDTWPEFEPTVKLLLQRIDKEIENGH